MGLQDKLKEMEKNMEINKKINSYFDNEDYINRLSLRFAHDLVDFNKIKTIIKAEMENGDYKNYQINQRFLEILKMDADTLYDLHLEGIDTSKYKSQSDLDNDLGEEYAQNYQNEQDELLKNSNRRIPVKNVKTLPKYEVKPKKIGMERFGPKRHGSAYKNNETLKKLEKELYGDETSYEQSMNDYGTENPEVMRTDVPVEKQRLLDTRVASIEVLKKVNSNTVLASSLLFLATGVLVAEAKEEMKWVKTELFIENTGIKINDPFIFHKYSEFTSFNAGQEDGYYVFKVGFNDQNVIYFRTKEKYLYEVLSNRIQNI